MNNTFVNFENVGTITLNNTCDVTDPCYGKDVWCRTTVTGMKPGIYNCLVANKGTGLFGVRVAETRILHESFSPNEKTGWERMGEIGVDAGLAGYFDNKPDFSDEEWSDFCDGLLTGSKFTTSVKDAYLGKFDGKDGFWTGSGYGDGGYSLYATKENGEVVGLWLIFIGDEEEYDDEEEYEED